MVFAPGMDRAETVAEVMSRLSMPIPECGCYAWLGTINEKGYAKVQYFAEQKRRTRRAAGVAYELAKGAIPKGLEVDHICRQRWCVNPDHLEAVTHRENIIRKWASPDNKKLVCKRGHPLETKADGTRFCRVCRNLSFARYDARNRDMRNAQRKERWRNSKGKERFCGTES